MERPAEIQEVIGQKRLADKVSGILERIEKELDSVEHSIGESMHVLDTDNDGMVGPPPPVLSAVTFQQGLRASLERLRWDRRQHASEASCCGENR